MLFDLLAHVLETTCLASCLTGCPSVWSEMDVLKTTCLEPCLPSAVTGWSARCFLSKQASTQRREGICARGNDEGDAASARGHEVGETRRSRLLVLVMIDAGAALSRCALEVLACAGLFGGAACRPSRVGAGRCYPRPRMPLPMRCGPFSAVRSGRWLPRASSTLPRRGRAPLGLGVAREVAAARGGICLSDHYASAHARLRWRCAEGHEWETALSSIRYSCSWCPYCAGNARLSLEIAKQVANERGGTCSSRAYVNSTCPLVWRCALGHEWSASLHSIRNTNTWCPQCAGNARLTLEHANSFAADRGGECLSSLYANAKTLLTWRCGVGHEWRASLNSVKNKRTWCPYCAGTGPLSLEIANNLAAKRGGECASTRYSNAKRLLSWRCSIGHQWRANLNCVKNRRTWCPYCAGNAPLSLEIARKLAAERRGLCLSGVYVSCEGHLDWRCADGHEWSASLHNVKNHNTWCPYCAVSKSERDVRSIFETIFSGCKFIRCRPQFLARHRGGRLEVDGYCNALQLAFEYNGRQHYEHVDYFHRNGNTLAATAARDELKRGLCYTHGICLVVIPHTVKDRWSYIRLCLLQWFPVSVIFPSALTP